MGMKALHGSREQSTCAHQQHQSISLANKKHLEKTVQGSCHAPAPASLLPVVPLHAAPPAPPCPTPNESMLHSEES